MLWVVSVGLLLSIGVLVASLTLGRRRPAHPVPWIIALVILALDVAIHVVMSIGSIAQSGLGGVWVGIGTVAIAGVLAAAVIRPRIAGYALIASAALMPLVLLSVWSWPGADERDLMPVPVMLGFWSTRAVIVGVILVLSEGMPWRARRSGPPA